MPLYEYKCTACEKHTEKIQKFSDPEITDCPFCGGHLERVISAPAISFKGGGWYADLYSSSKPKAASAGGTDGRGNESGASAGSASSDSSSTPAASAPPPASAAAPAASSASADKK